MENYLISQVDPFVYQLLVEPFISVSAGVIVYLIFRRVWIAPILSLIVQASISFYMTGIAFSSWSIILPSASLFITLALRKKDNKKIKLISYGAALLLLGPIFIFWFMGLLGKIMINFLT